MRRSKQLTRIHLGAALAAALFVLGAAPQPAKKPAAPQPQPADAARPQAPAPPPDRYHLQLEANPAAPFPWLSKFDTIRIDADPVSGTLVFSSDRSTVVADAGMRRDARSAPTDEQPVTTTAGSRGRKNVLDVPDIDRPKRDRDGGELVN